MTGSKLLNVLKGDVRKMARSISKDERGSIYPLIIAQVEKYLIEVVLEETQHNYFHAARYLGISRSTLYRKIQTLLIAEKHGNKVDRPSLMHAPKKNREHANG